MTEPILTAAHLTMDFGSKTVFNDLNFTIHAGEKISLIGHNGAGKTTLVKILLGLLAPTAGTVTKRSPSGQAKLKIGYVPQFRNIDADAPLSIASFVALNVGLGWRPWLSANEKKRIADVLALTDLTAIKDRPITLTSGGEQQRAYLAQALLADPELLILDEATASMDVDAKKAMMDLVVKVVTQRNMALLFVSHDLELTARYTDRYLLITDETLATGSSKEVNADSLKGVRI
ncbi:MAG: ATP-binding cassette domain-containing protein [Lactobacillaceae bacterium]|jgi:zinc/manganese transport system ATP-binding protein|nr:ATP-binding cassette domain-containing protein [Lactobacillaceae bacterium]